MATKLTTSIHREVNLKDENGTPHDYIVTLKAGKNPSVVLRRKRHQSEIILPLEKILAPTEFEWEYE
mgnify:FL=1|tara:strand:+ start:1154 stop:1354 length:201 start_codon:yes stop_codon:yes gene_type:complete